jgi:hypothetical protein
MRMLWTTKSGVGGVKKMRRMTQIASVLLAVALAGVALMSPTAADEEEDEFTIVDLSLGFPYQEDFQFDNGGWTTTEVPPPPEADRPDPVNPSWEHGEIPDAPERPSPTNPQWEWGEPTSGPGEAATGTNAWAINLAGNYVAPTCAAIMSPPIDLTGAADASIAFQSWIHSDASTSLSWHGGLVFVTTDGGNTLTVVTPDEGYPGPGLGTTARTCLDNQPSGQTAISGGPSADYSQFNVDLSSFTGQEVQVVFGFGSDGVGSGNYAGWYLDEFATTIDGNTVVEDFESSDGGFTVTSTAAPAGILPPGAKSGSNAWATELGGALSTIECSGLMSPPIDLTSASSASASFYHWYHMRETTSAWHAGLVFATTDGGKTLDVITPLEGYDSSGLAFAARNCLDEQPLGTQAISGGPPADWEQLNFDLDDYIGEEVQLVLGFRKDAVGDWSGWYMDDFATTIDGVTTVEDFENGDGGFTIVSVEPPTVPPYPKGWEWGEPTTGPAGENLPEGTHLWATQLHEDYGHLECSWIESPSFTVGPIPNALEAIQEATLTWKHWFRSNSIYASGVVQVGHNGEYHILEPEGGYPGTIGSTSSLNEEVTQWQTDCFGMDWQPGDPLERGFSGTAASTGGYAIGEEMGVYQADLTQYVGEEITLRFIFASGWRDVNPTTQLGWYVDDIQVEHRVKVTGPSPEGIVDDLLGGGDAPGWSSGGRPGENDWEWGQDGGSFAYATNLVGPYSLPSCGYIESPAFSASALADDATLTIDHRYSSSQSGSFAWYAGLVAVSADGGPWTLVEFDDQAFTASTPARTCFGDVTGQASAPTGTPAFGAWQPEYHTSETDLAAFADADELRIRFIFGGTSTVNTGCDELENPCDGWYIRGVQAGGQELLALPESVIPGLPL